MATGLDAFQNQCSGPLARPAASSKPSNGEGCVGRMLTSPVSELWALAGDHSTVLDGGRGGGGGEWLLLHLHLPTPRPHPHFIFRGPCTRVFSSRTLHRPLVQLKFQTFC